MTNAKNLLAFVISLGEAIDKATADKKVNMLDVPLLIEPLMKAGPAFSEFQKALDEFKDASASELAELAEFVENDLALRSERTEDLIEESFDVALKLYSIVQAFRSQESVIELALGIIALLKTIGSIYKDHLEKDWVSEIEQIEEKLWKELNLPDESKDMARIDGLLQELKRKAKKAETFLRQMEIKK